MIVGLTLRLLTVAALLGAAAAVGLPLGQQPAAAAPTTCAAPVSLVNGDFETPVVNVTDATKGAYVITAQTNVPGWQTTATDKKIEIWRQPFNQVYAASGTQHAELNANQVSTLYQDVATTGGQTLRWELKHRGRAGIDTMALLIGAPGGALVSQGQYADGRTAWGTWSGFYTVPNGQSTTRFAFESVSAAGGSQGLGNFLDAISFGTSACLLATTTVSGTAADVGDVLTYTVTARNDGGNPAQLSVLADDLPAGTTLVPGSIRSISGTATTTISDAADGDTGEYDAATRTVRVRAGTGATAASGGVIAVGDSRSITYQARVTSAAAASTISNDATAAYTDALTGSRPVAVSTTVSTAVGAAADLAVSAVITAPGVIAGGTATAVVTARNTGPNTATGTQLTAVAPAGITGVTATSPEGPCTTAGSTVRCDAGALAPGATATMTVTGGLSAAAPPGLQASLTASVAATTFEINQSDNATSVSGAVTALADLGVTMTNTPGVAGAPITYTATITNRGPSVARGIVLTDPVPATATFSSASVAGGACALTATGTVECTVPDLNPGDTATVSVTMVLTSTAINNAVSVTAATPDPDAADNNFSVQSAGTAVADVGVSLRLGATSAYAGDPVPYTLTVTNHGPSAATNVTFNTVVPPGVTILRDPQFCTANACTLPLLPAGASVPLSGQARIGPDATAGPGRASTTIISPTTDTNAANDTDTVTFTIDLSADLDIAQTLTNPGDATALVAGQTVDGAVTVTNNGRTRAEGVVVRQAIPAGRPVPAASPECAFQGAGVPGGITADGGAYVCTRPTLATGGTWRLDFTGVLLSTGYSDTVYTRTAVVFATTADPVAANDSVTTTRAVERRADLRITETTSTPAVVQTEDARFRVAVRNLGPSDAADVVIRLGAGGGLLITGGAPVAGAGDYDPATVAWTLTSLTAGGTAELDLTAVAQHAGTLTTSARLHTSGSIDTDASNDDATVSVQADAAEPALHLTVHPTVTGPGDLNGVEAGGRIDYSYTVVNTGNLTMTALTVTGTRGGAATCGAAGLAPGAGTSCTAGGHTVGQPDIDAAAPIVDTVRAFAVTSAAHDPVRFAEVSTSVPVAVAHPSLTVAVTPVVTPAEHQHAAATGDRIGYTYRVTNNGTATMTAIALTVTRATGASCPQSSLAVGDAMTCTVAPGDRYTVTQADVDAAQPVTAAASVTATGTGIGYAFGPFTAGVPVAAAAPALTLAVTPSRTAPAGAGDTIGYSYRVTNTGNVTLSALAVADTRAGAVTCAPGDLAVAASRVCTAATPYTVTQADVDAGAAIAGDAVVTATGPAPAGLPVTAQDSVPVPVVAAAPALGLAGIATVTPGQRQGAAAAGDAVIFHYTVTNTGNVTMQDVSVTDPLAGPVSCPRTTLPATTDMVCATGPYRVTQDDIDTGGPLTTTAETRGRAPAATAPAGYGTETVTVGLAAPETALTLTLDAVVTPPEAAAGVEEGDEIGYRYTVANTGNTTVERVGVTDDRLGEAGCPQRTLAVGESVTCASTRTHTVDADDVDAGRPIENSATAYGRRPGTTTDVRFGPAHGQVPLRIAAPALTVAVAADVDPDAHQHAVRAGDTIRYRYRVTNNGNATMSAVAVTDAPAGPVTCPQTVLHVRAGMTCTATRPVPVTQADVDADRPVTNQAYVTGTPPAPAAARRFGPFTARVPVVAAAAALRMSVTAAVTPSAHRAAVEAGDEIRYRYTITNTGNVTVGDLVARDSRTGTATCTATTLGPDASVTCVSAAYRVAQADLDAGRRIATTVAATATRRGGAPVEARTTVVGVPVAAAAPRLTARQRAAWTDTDGDGVLGVRDDVVSTVVVTNTGNVTVTGLTVTGLPAAVTCARHTVAPGEQVRCVSAVYRLTGHDIAAGHRTAEAFATGAALGSRHRPVRAAAA
ncbi:hypothetical protein AB0F81_14225, partial [Actinoplanes sp. NPDC024001]|uniref:DUF7507 domain-containing protein n=1 Tax=Actinoplanes sp. NPDC024001 TaxID=3154598 RepID=UPI0033DFB8A0